MIKRLPLNQKTKNHKQRFTFDVEVESSSSRLDSNSLSHSLGTEG